MKRLTIAGKQVYVVDAHHEALQAWAEVRRELEAAPYLISLDYHPDNIRAFRHYAALAPGFGDLMTNAGRKQRLQYSDMLVEAVDFRSPDSVAAAIDKLRHDEQLNCAVRADILRHAFVVQEQEPATPSIQEREYAAAAHQALMARAERSLLKGIDGCWDGADEADEEYEEPAKRDGEDFDRCEDGVMLLDRSVACPKECHDDDCLREHSDFGLEDRLLALSLRRIVTYAATALGGASPFEEDYILDIDLDYFNSRSALEPQSHDVFYALVRNSLAITVAREDGWVDELWQDDNASNADALLARLIEHFKQALGADG